MTLEKERKPFGIGVLEALCALAFLFALMDLAAGIFGIHAGSYSSRYAFPESTAQRAVGDGIGLSCGLLFYATRRRLRVAWKLGRAVLIGSFLSTAAEALASVINAEKGGDPWTAAAFVMVVFSAVAAYWLRWWYRQKYYFYRGKP